MAATADRFIMQWLRAGLGLAFLAIVGPAAAQDAAAVDARTGTVRIYVSLATSAMTRLVAAVNKHFPNLKVEFVRSGSLETVKRFVAERQAGRIAADLIHGADPGGFEYFAEKGWLDPRLAATSSRGYRDGFFDQKAGWVALRATGIALMYNTKLVAKDALEMEGPHRHF
jgi:ABC-type glycerol-3-phosphate transport system substrate-binding protein